MPHRIDLSDNAARSLRRTETRTAARISDAIAALASDPRPPGSVVLSGFAPRVHRIRVGDYRIVYLVEDDVEAVYVLAVGHRRDIYRQLSR